MGDSREHVIINVEVAPPDSLISDGANRDFLYEVISLVLNETYYSLLLALDGEASLGGTQICYKIFDEEQNLLNECGEIEAAAFECFIEK